MSEIQSDAEQVADVGAINDLPSPLNRFADRIIKASGDLYLEQARARGMHPEDWGKDAWEQELRRTR